MLDLAVRWVLDQGITTALWGARRPDQLGPVGEVMGWHLDSSAKAEIEQETNRAREELRASVAALAIDGASRILQREVDSKAHAKLLDDLVKQL